MQLCIKDTAYKLLVVYFATGVNDDGEFRKFMGFEGLGYYIFKGDEFVAHLSKVDFVDGLKKYFPGCVEFIRQIEEEKTSYKDLYSLINKYKMEHGDAFYVKPLNKKEVK